MRIATASARNARSDKLPSYLLGAFALIWLVLAVAPVSREDWLLENLLVFIAAPTLIAGRRRLRFSNGSYLCLFVFLTLHAIGAHYTYALTPYDQWWEALTGRTLNDVLGFERNHYDRLVHFLYGALILPPVIELLDFTARPRGVWRALLPITFVMSQSALYEVVEWIAALIVAPELGTAYLGTQGDGWDAQKDMALALAGAALTTALLQVGAIRRWFSADPGPESAALAEL